MQHFVPLGQRSSPPLMAKLRKKGRRGKVVAFGICKMPIVIDDLNS